MEKIRRIIAISFMASLMLAPMEKLFARGAPLPGEELCITCEELKVVYSGNDHDMKYTDLGAYCKNPGNKCRNIAGSDGRCTDNNERTIEVTDANGNRVTLPYPMCICVANPQ